MTISVFTHEGPGLTAEDRRVLRTRMGLSIDKILRSLKPFYRKRRTAYTRRSSTSRAACRASQHAMLDGGLASCSPVVYVTGGRGKRARAPSLLRRRLSPPHPPPQTLLPRLRLATENVPAQARREQELAQHHLDCLRQPE